MTRWPTLASVSLTPGPTAATTPQGSWPPMTGPLPPPRPRALAALPAARYGCRSLPHMPEALMAMTTSPGPGVGSGNSRSSSFRLPRKTMPFISVSFAFVDERQERLPRAEPPEGLAERRGDAAGPSRRAARGGRRDDHARGGPERGTRRQGLGGRGDEARAPQPSPLQAAEEGPARPHPS